MASECARADVAERRREWLDERQPHMRRDPGRLVFIDETSVNTKMIRLRGRAPRGERLKASAPIFAAKPAEANGSIAALSETERSLAGQLGSASTQITDEAIQRFGQALRANIIAENSAMRRAYVRLLVSNVTINDNEIVIAGSQAALENAAQGDPATCAAVPVLTGSGAPIR